MWQLTIYWASGKRDLISMVTFTFTMQRHLIRLAYAPFRPISSRLATFGGLAVWFDFRVQHVRSIMQNLRTVGENSDPILSRLWTKVHEIFRRCRKPEDIGRSSCQVVQKRWFLCPRFVGGGVSQISDMHFQTTLTSDHVADFRWVPLSDLGD